jgi:TRAP-type C4-dicarboxylate transport system substrate-binding protein
MFRAFSIVSGLLCLSAWRAPLAGLAALLAMFGTAFAQPTPVRLKIVGGLADLEQYTRYEVPFWTTRVPQLTGGAVQAEIAPFDRSGIRAQDLPRLLRLGVVSFANVLLAVAAADDPELDGIDLPLLNPDITSLRRTTELWRPHLAGLLRERYGIELLAIYTYPAQVVLCRGSYTGLADLKGRRVRTSSVAQAELMTALGAVPVVIPFAEVVPAIRNGVVQCAITGALSAQSIGLTSVATHVSPRPVNWGIAFFGANRSAWMALSEDIRRQLRAGLAQLETEIWRAADQANIEGIECAAGEPECPPERRGHLVVVAEPRQPAEREGLLSRVVLPGWAARCGQPCAASWNNVMAAGIGLRVESD